jgi:hypothetical protein
MELGHGRWGMEERRPGDEGNGRREERKREEMKMEERRNGRGKDGRMEESPRKIKEVGRRMVDWGNWG